MENYSEKEIKDMINILVAEGYAGMTEGQYPVLKLREKAVPVLKNREKVYRIVPKRKVTKVEDNTLFEILRSLRKKISAREKYLPTLFSPTAS